jgi:hypothetical protein
MERKRAWMNINEPTRFWRRPHPEVGVRQQHWNAGRSTDFVG